MASGWRILDYSLTGDGFFQAMSVYGWRRLQARCDNMWQDAAFACHFVTAVRVFDEDHQAAQCCNLLLDAQQWCNNTGHSFLLRELQLHLPFSASWLQPDSQVTASHDKTSKAVSCSKRCTNIQLQMAQTHPDLQSWLQHKVKSLGRCFTACYRNPRDIWGWPILLFPTVVDFRQVIYTYRYISTI